MTDMNLASLDSHALQSLAGGNAEARAELVRRYIPLVKSRVLFFYGATEEFEDLFQEGMIGLLSALSDFDPAAGVPFGCFAKLCVDRALGNYGRSRVHRDAAFLPLEETVSSASEPEAEVVVRDEAARLLREARERLTELEYAVLCYKVSGYRNAEIASIMAVSPKSVENAVQRYKRKLIN